MPMERRTAIVQEAIRWIGTPYVHGQHSIHGCDCIGLCIGIGKNVGALSKNYRPKPYPQDWHLHNSRERMHEGILEAGGIEVTGNIWLPGDILLMEHGKTRSHAAIIIAIDPFIEIVESSITYQKVTRNRPHPSVMKRRARAAYLFPGVI